MDSRKYDYIKMYKISVTEAVQGTVSKSFH